MYPSRFRYEQPTSIAAAIELLSTAEDPKVLAGGQSLIPMMKLRFANPATIIDINNIPGLDYHRADERRHLPHRGAMSPRRPGEVEHAGRPSAVAWQPPLHWSPIPLCRTRGTLVGSVCHADPQGDWASCMIALDGSVSRPGAKRQTIDQRERLRGRTHSKRFWPTTKSPSRPWFPAAKGTRRGGYLKLERRVGDFATAGVAIALDMSGDRGQQRRDRAHRRRPGHGQRIGRGPGARRVEVGSRCAVERGGPASRRRVVAPIRPSRQCRLQEATSSRPSCPASLPTSNDQKCRWPDDKSL